MDPEQPPGERPKWSITWLLRIQRVGRNRREPAAGGDTGSRVNGWAKIFQWGVILLLIVEIAVAVWLGLLPR